MSFERPAQRPPTLAQFFADFGGVYAANGLIGFIFAARGPVARGGGSIGPMPAASEPPCP